MKTALFHLKFMFEPRMPPGAPQEPLRVPPGDPQRAPESPRDPRIDRIA